MNFSENISLQKYAENANHKFNETESRLSQIEGSFQTRMDGKTTGGLICSMFGTFCWLVAICVSFWFIRKYVNSTICLICFVISIALVISLFLGEIIDLSYYGKISSYKNNITRLKNRINIGKSSIKSNQDAFMKSCADGWFHPISVGTSIPEEATHIESTINSMESLKGGFISGLKNFLFFTFAIAITAIGSWALFGTAEKIMNGISGKSIDYSTINTLCIIGLLITMVGEIILAKIVWSKTDCSVTNTTLFIAAVGPLLFLALITIATLLVMLVVLAVGIIIAVVGVVIAGACIFGSISGG